MEQNSISSNSFGTKIHETKDKKMLKTREKPRSKRTRPINHSNFSKNTRKLHFVSDKNSTIRSLSEAFSEETLHSKLDTWKEVCWRVERSYVHALSSFPEGGNPILQPDSSTRSLKSCTTRRDVSWRMAYELWSRTLVGAQKSPTPPPISSFSLSVFLFSYVTRGGRKTRVNFVSRSLSNNPFHQRTAA